MIINIERESLLKPLQYVSGIIEKAHTIRILSNVLLRTDDHELTLVGSDSNIQIVATTPIKVDTPGAFTVPAKKLLDICRLLPNSAMINLCWDEKKVDIKSGNSLFSLKTLSARDFPRLNKIEGNLQFFIEEHVLKKAIENTSFCMGIEDVRKFLNGLYFGFEQDQLKIIASDGHRLALNVVSIDNPLNENIEIILPRKAILELLKILDDRKTKIKVSITKRFICLEIDSIEYTAKIMDCKFPDYRNIIPEEVNNQMKVETQAIKEALTRVSILSNEVNCGVILEIVKNKITLNSHNSDYDRAEESIDVEYDDDRLVTSFNAMYVLEALKRIDSENAILDFKNAKGSMIIAGEFNHDNKFVVMPMRL